MPPAAARPRLLGAWGAVYCRAFLKPGGVRDLAMSRYAVIEDSGTQIMVREGDEIRVALRDLPPEAASVTFDRVLLVGDAESAGDLRIGSPLVEGASVTADVLAEDSQKCTIFKFKRRKNYKRKKGHRQHFLRVRVTAIAA